MLSLCRSQHGLLSVPSISVASVSPTNLKVTPQLQKCGAPTTASYPAALTDPTPGGIIIIQAVLQRFDPLCP